MGRNVAISRVARAAGIAALAATAVVISGCTNSGSADTSNPIAGKQLFVKKCGACHTLARAGTKGVVGPNLDDAFRVARKEGWGDNAIRGVVLGQIGFPGKGTLMPANLVTGDDARDVADYVSAVAAKPGKDAGLLATAVKAPGGGKPAVEANGVLKHRRGPGRPARLRVVHGDRDRRPDRDPDAEQVRNRPQPRDRGRRASPRRSSRAASRRHRAR